MPEDWERSHLGCCVSRFSRHAAHCRKGRRGSGGSHQTHGARGGLEGRGPGGCPGKGAEGEPFGCLTTGTAAILAAACHVSADTRRPAERDAAVRAGVTTRMGHGAAWKAAVPVVAQRRFWGGSGRRTSERARQGESTDGEPFGCLTTGSAAVLAAACHAGADKHAPPKGTPRFGWESPDAWGTGRPGRPRSRWLPGERR